MSDDSNMTTKATDERDSAMARQVYGDQVAPSETVGLVRRVMQAPARAGQQPNAAKAPTKKGGA